MFPRLALALILILSLGGVHAEDAKTKETPKESPRKSKVEWESTATLAGTITNTTIKGGNGGGNNRRTGQGGKGGYDDTTVKPVYESFTTTAPAFRIKWDVNPTEKRGDIRVMLDKEVERGKSKDWRSAGSVGPIRLGEKGEKFITLGPGNYRLEMTGYSVKYAFTIEEAKKAE